MGPRRCEVHHQILCLPADHVGQRGRAALVGHAERFELEQLVQGFGRNLHGGRAVGVIELALVGMRVSDELGRRAHRQGCVHREDERKVGEAANRREISNRVVGQLLENMRVDRVRGVGREEQGVAVGRCLGDKARRNLRGGTGPVVNHKGLAERHAQLLADHAREDVGAAAGAETDHDAHRFVWIRLLRLGRWPNTDSGEQRDSGDDTHNSFQ